MWKNSPSSLHDNTLLLLLLLLLLILILCHRHHRHRHSRAALSSIRVMGNYRYCYRCRCRWYMVYRRTTRRRRTGRRRRRRRNKGNNNRIIKQQRHLTSQWNRSVVLVRYRYGASTRTRYDSIWWIVDWNAIIIIIIINIYTNKGNSNRIINTIRRTRHSVQYW